MADGVEQAPKRELSLSARPRRSKNKDVLGPGQPSTEHLPDAPKPPEDYRVPGVKPDPMLANGHHAEENAANAEKIEKKAAGMPPAMKEALDNMRAAAETAVLVSTMGQVGDRNGRWKFLNTLDRVDDPNVRKKMAAQFESQTGQKLGDFVENAGWHSKRDKEQAKDLISHERGEVETKLAELEQKSPAAFKARERQAKEWATKILSTTRADDVDDDKSAKTIFDTLGQRTPEEIELIRRQIRESSGGRSAYQEIDKSLSGGTEDEALAGLKGSKVTSVAAGIKNADGNADRIKELLRRLDHVEIAELKKTNPMIDMIAIQSVDGGQRAEIAALLEGNKAKANAAQITDLFKDPRDGLDMDGIKLTKQSEQNLENRKTANVIKALRDMPAADILAAKVAWENDPANEGKTWNSMIEARFGDGDSTTLLRIRALADGNKVEERAYALRDAMRTQNQEEIEAAIASPDLHSDDPMKRSIAIAERFELEQRVRALDDAAARTTAVMTGRDPNAVVGRDMQHQLNDYYREYGDKVPHPKDFTSMLDVMSDIDEVKEKRAAKANEDSIAAGELEQQGKLSTTTQVRRAEVKGDLEHKAQLLENLGSAGERVEVEKDFEARYGKSVYKDPRAAQFHAAAKFLKDRGDDRPLSEIEIDIANKERNANEHRVHNVQVYGAKAERDPYLQYLLQKEQFERQHSDSLEAEEMMREMRGGNIGVEDLNRHNLAAMEQQFVAQTNPFDMTPRALRDGVTREDFDAHDKSVTNTLEVQRTEKMKHGERLAMAFSTLAKIGALLAGQPHLVFLIDAAAGLTEMAIKSSTMGNDYDSSLDTKMFGLTMAVDALTMGAGKYFSSAANKLDDVAAAKNLGQSTATEVVEQATTSQAKKELAEGAVKQVVATEASLAGKVAGSADDVAEGGVSIAKTEQAIAKVETTAAENSVQAAAKSLQRKEMVTNLALGAGHTAGASMIQGENGDDMLYGIARGMLGMLVPHIAGGKLDKVLGTNAFGTGAKALLNFGSEVAIGGGDVGMAALSAGVNARHGYRSKKAQKGQHDDHLMSHFAEEPTYRPRVDDDRTVARKLPSEPIDPHVLANGHNAEVDLPSAAATPGLAPALPFDQVAGPIPTTTEPKVRPDLSIERAPIVPQSLDGLPIQERIDRVTGVSKDADYERGQQDLAAFYANQELEAANVTRVRGKHFEEGTSPDYANAWNSSYSVREFQYDNARLTQVGIDVHLTPGKGVGDAELAAVRANTYRGVDQFYNYDSDGHMHQLPNGSVLHVEPNFVERPENADLGVRVESGRIDPDTNRRRRTRMNEWLLDDVVPTAEGPGAGPVVPAHELTHVLGPSDEYVEPEIKRRQTIDSEGVIVDGSLMGDLYREGGTPEVKQRHLRMIGDDIDRHRGAAADTLKIPAISDADAELLLRGEPPKSTSRESSVVLTDPSAETLRFPAQREGITESDTDRLPKRMSDSKRNSTPLTGEEIEQARARSIELGMPGEDIIVQSDDPAARTSWGRAFGQERLYIADDVKPAVPHQDSAGEWVSLTPNQRVSSGGAIGHEIVGHREADLAGKGKTQSYETYAGMDPETRQVQQIRDNALDEAQASLRAAKFTPDLSKKERKILFEDAMDRLEKVGLSVDDVPDLDLYLDQR